MRRTLAEHIAGLRPGDHLCLLYESAADQVAAAVPFVQAGLARGACCAYVADGRSGEEAARALMSAGIDVPRERERGALTFPTGGEYRLGGDVSSRPMTGVMKRLVDQALAAGFPGLWLAVDMTWALGPEVNPERLVEWEHGLDRFLAGAPVVAICQYDRHRLAPAAIQGVLHTHPVAILGQQVCPNHYYEPPDLVPGPGSETNRVEWMMAQLRGAHRAEEALGAGEERYRIIAEAASDGIITIDEESRIVFVNRAAERIFGYTRAEMLGEPLTMLMPESLRPAHRASLHRYVETGKRHLTWERVQLPGLHKRGSEIPLEISFGEFFKDGRRTFTGVVRDIIERKRAEEEVQRLYQEAERGRQEAEAYAALVRDLAASLELERTLEHLVVQAKVLGQGDFAFLALVEKDGQTLTIRAETGAPPVTLRDLTRMKGKGMTGKVVETGEPLVTANYLQDPRFSHDYDAVIRAEGTIAQAAVPIIHEGITLGVLVVARRTPRPFAPTELQLLLRLADAASLACHNALLYQQATTRAVALERLWRLGQALTHSLALPETLDRIVQTARDLLRADHARLTLWDEATRCLTVAAQAGGEALPFRKKIHLGQGVIGAVAETRRPLIVNDYQVFPLRIPELTSVTASMGVPLLMEERLIGTLVVGVTEAGRTFTAEDLQLLELLAQPAATAIENARLFEQVRAGRERLQTISRRLIEAQEGERRRIARELHDEVGQVLTAVKINLQTMQRLSDSEPVLLRLEESTSTVERAIQQVRNLSLDLRPSMLDDLGLVAALRWHVDRHAQRAGFAAQFVADPLEIRAPAHIETACFRVAQEALTNVMRHARAKRVCVEVRQREMHLELVIHDDGVGFDVDQNRERAARGASFGLLGMHERAQLVGGQIEIDSTLNGGTTVRARFPLNAFLEKRGGRRASG